MQYTKPMIDLVYEIRRRVEPTIKPGVKMANPELLRELVDYYHTTGDTITKTLIKELLSLAGDDWRALVNAVAESAPVREPPRQIVKVYRGQTILVDAPRQDDQDKSNKHTRIYRGRPVVSAEDH